MKITKSTKMLKLLEKKPEAIEVLFNAGVMCVGCGMAQYETLEQGMKVHGMSDKEIDKVVEEINRLEKGK